MLPARIGPYRVDGLLGEGGMGEVYRAFDETLERPVAIKTIRATRDTDPAWRQRFRREARSAARLTHPAIVRIHHVQSEKGHDYIVMELVEGRTLTEALHQDGPLGPRDAAAFFREVAAGLADAHRHGIVHRDIKTGNLMVTPEGNAKILDFGLASTEASMSVSAVGTPHTMSPEQLTEGKVDHRSDLFSLGAVLYEALTGEAPFRADTVPETVARVLTRHVRPVAELDPTIPPALSQLLVRLLEKDRESRPQSAAEVVAELDRFLAAGASGQVAAEAPVHEQVTTRVLAGEPVSLPAAGQPVPGVSRRRLVFAVLGLVIVLGVALALRSLVFRQDEPRSGTTPVVRPAVAVLGLENLSGRTQDAWLGTAISELLVTELQAGGQIRVIGSDEVARALRELGTGRLDEVAGEDLARLGRSLGVPLLVSGTYGDLSAEDASLLRIDLRLEDVASGRRLAAESSTGTPGQLAALVGRVAARFREQLHAGALTAAKSLAAEASFPADREAVRLYSDGLARLRRLDALGARDLLQQAIAAEPEHPMPHAALAEAWSLLGYEAEALAAAGKARELAGRLGETARSRIQARYHTAAQEWDEAVGIYATLFAASPDDLDFGLELAEARIKAGKLQEAQVTLDQLRRLPPPLALDPRIDLAQARACYQQGDVAQMRLFAERAARRGEQLGAPLLVAQARLRLTTALLELGEYQPAMASLDEAKLLFDAHGDRQGSANAIELMAHAVLEQQGDLAVARRLFETAQAVYREIGNRRRAAGVRGSLGSILIRQGQLRKAVEVLDETLATFQELGDKHEAAIVLNNLGFVLFAQGEWEAAIGRYTEALNLSDQLRDKSGVACAYTNIAEILYVRGDLDRAREMHEEALVINSEILDQVGIAYDTFRLGKILAARGDLFAARQKYNQALAAQSDLAEAAAAAETRMELAVLELIEGRPEEAETLARQSEQVARNEGWSDLAALARAVLVRALLARGQVEAARETMAGVETSAAESEDPRVLFLTALTAARVRATAPEEVLAAVADLDEVARQAAAAGYLEESFEARLAAGEIEMAAGKPAEGAVRLTALQDEARDRGYAQIARRAAAARPASPAVVTAQPGAGSG